MEAMSIRFVEIVMIAATVVILLWDLWLYRDEIKGNTISQIVRKRTSQNPVIPLLFGMLLGHWFL